MDGGPRGQVMACIECEERPRVRGAWCAGCWAAMVREFMAATAPWN